MIALDTNVLVRFLVDDDAAQRERARRLLARALRDDERVLVSVIVACETVWVLSSAYSFTREQIAGVLDSLLRSPQLEFEHADDVRAALEAHRSGRGDFADYVIRERARRNGCEAVATFDKTLLKERGFVAP